MQWHRWIASIALAAIGGHPWRLAAGVDRVPATPVAIQVPFAPTWPGSDRYRLVAGANGTVYLTRSTGDAEPQQCLDNTGWCRGDLVLARVRVLILGSRLS